MTNSDYFYDAFRGSSVAERPTVNRVAVGSTPTPGAIQYLRLIRPTKPLVVRERSEVSAFRNRRKRNPKAIGELSEAAVVHHLVRAGYDVARPLGDNARYDLIVEDVDGRFIRVQVKTGRLKRDGAVHFPTSSSQAHRGGGRQSYRGQCELFAVYCPELDESYLVPVEETGSRGCSLRVRPTINHQARGVRWAADYRLAAVDLRSLVPVCVSDGPRVGGVTSRASSSANSL